MKKVKLFLMMLSISFIGFGGVANAGSNYLVADTTQTESAGSMAVVLCNVLSFVTGTVGKTLASFVIIGVGLGFFTGKVSWGALIGVTLGLSALFGAPTVIRAVAGGGAICTFE